MFADDTNILGRKLTRLDQTIETCENWANINKMALNKSKSKLMFIDDERKFT